MARQEDLDKGYVAFVADQSWYRQIVNFKKTEYTTSIQKECIQYLSQIG